MANGTFAEMLLDRAGDDHPGLLFEDASYTWAEVVLEARGRAGLLASFGPPPGAPGRPWHVGVLLENVPEYVFWIGGAALAGATVVGVNPTRRGDELAADIRHTDCDLIVTDSAHAALLDGLDTGVPDDRVLRVDSEAYAARLPGEPAEPARVAPGDRLLLLFTSGSTGAPKAVACGQGRLAAIARNAERMSITRDSVTYIAMPLFHGNALMANLAMAVHAGATVAMRRKFSASGFLPDVRRYGVTYFNYVGRALAYILATPERPDDADNPLCALFGTEASAQDMARFSARFGCRIIEGYGSSEGAISIQKTPDTPPDALGVPPQGMEVAVLDPATGRECPPARFGPDGGLLNPGEAIGEIVGLNVAAAFEGYYNNPEADAERVRDGKYWSGDLGYRDADGFFYFAGRGNDRLRVDSENFAAAPVERILSCWEPVVMCAVYPVPDPRTGDQVMAALELGGPFDPDAFTAFLAGRRDLGTKWAPRFVRIVESMPLTATGKVDKRPLRRARWDVSGDGAVWWRPGRGLAYEPLTAGRAEAISAEFRANGRSHVLTAL
ncbi:putative fatty-acid-CoA ligase FadD [Actinomadura sp. NBRC 104412]|uniref:AMP-binding protein n=1 Tax=Actinomadura sp. NBRC 104412 TaxID=3032203 RepID=UPI0024A2D8A4|nr:AMP-binding protein [Actinomadura sp. NBRC 104412]GLZ04185.1 putative fatty-acid-CoA ligase FadD [Actinomadura sp. NBRC 104412]